jgi:hypothetical protein
MQWKQPQITADKISTLLGKWTVFQKEWKYKTTRKIARMRSPLADKSCLTLLTIIGKPLGAET